MHNDTGADHPTTDRATDVAQLVAELERQLGDWPMSPVGVWATYDQLKIKRVLSYVSYESWLALLRTCQRRPPRPHGSRELAKQQQQQQQGTRSTQELRRWRTPPAPQDWQRRLPDVLGEDRGNDPQETWSPTLSKRRAVMFLGDMWRYSGAPPGVGEKSGLESYSLDAELPSDSTNTDTVSPIWRPLAHHYNIALDVVGRDFASPISELAMLHRNMRTHGIREDTITFNTLLNACRLRRAWGHFQEIEAQFRKRDEWGVTRMNATTWCTLIRGYGERQDWAAVDRCVAEASRACRLWHESHATDGKPAQGIQPDSELWNAIISIYAARDMVPQMITSRRVMLGLGLALSTSTFVPIFTALHRLRRSLTRDRRDAWPAISLALEEFNDMRRSGVAPNALILTNIALTVGLSNRYAKPAHVHDGQDERTLSKLRDIGGEVAQQLESMLARARNPNVYVALLNLGGSSGALEDVHAVWQTLVMEAQFSQDASAPPLMTSLTLAAYMNALMRCKKYHEAISAFRIHASPTPTSERRERARADVSKPQVREVGRPVYDAAIQAYARVGQHRTCVRILRSMIAKGIPPTALTVRYALLHPDRGEPDSGLQQHTERWVLPLAIATNIWAMVLDCRQKEWARGALPEPVDVTALSDDQLPVIVNDIAAQFIRIAAHACNTRFGEEVFEALCAEAAHYRMGHRRRDDDDDDDSASDDAANADDDAESDASDKAMAERRIRELHQCAPNVYTYTSMISLYSNSADLSGVQRMWAKMLDDGIEPRIHTYTSLVVALHRVALRRRWRQARERTEDAASESADPGWALSSGSLGMEADVGPGAKRPAGGDSTRAQLTPQDETIWRVEDWLIAATTDGVEAAAAAGDAQLGLDIPLSTLLLRYHSLRIHEAVSGDKAKQDDEGAVEDIARVMRVCQAVEQTGLRPDRRFHAALADFFDTCGDPTGANLVRERMGSLGEAG